MALKPCKSCGVNVSATAKSCPSCGHSHPAGGWTLGAKIGFGLIVLWVLGYACSDHDSSVARQNDAAPAPPAVAAPRTPELSIDAQSLWAEYDANEVAADSRYKGKTIVVSGTVQAIDKDFLDNAIVRLVTSNQFETVDATMAKAAAGSAAQLSKGQSVQLVCKVRGRTLGSPQLGECEVR